ncbi:erythroblast macrophage protein EMP [Aphelenchoides avenae]|nr:erythroblast macrophage protein EMP [Aphelenchus avenae]
MSARQSAAPFVESTEVTALEYSQLKVPYELLNKKFRAAQKTIDQHNFYFKKNVASLEAVTKDGSEPIPVAPSMKQVVARLTQFQEDVERGMEEEIEAAKALLLRADYLKQWNSTDPSIQEAFRNQRLNRFIVEHLLRCGYFETAQKLAEHSGAEQFSNKYVFHVAKQVEESLKRHDLSICLNWLVDNRSKLHRLNSTFETEVKVQQCIELIRLGKKSEAVSFIRLNFSGLPANRWQGTLLQLMGLLAFGADTQLPSYKRLLGDERWDELIELFRQENAKIFQISAQSAFSACLQAGISAHKTPYCKKHPGSKCVICDNLYDIAEGLPYAHVSNSRLICSASGEPLNEANQPMMLPNGRVYGEKSLRKLTKDKEIKCPRTNESFSVEEVVRVYIL